MKDKDLIFGLMASLGKETYSIRDLLYLTRPFGTTETSLRTNLSRMSRHGLLESFRKEKSVFYHFSIKALEISANVAKGFRALDWTSWDERWWGVLFSVPELRSQERYRIRKKLTAYRFAPLYSGTWIRPCHSSEKLEIHLKNILENPHCKMIRFECLDSISTEEIRRLWKLDGVQSAFNRSIQLIDKNLKNLDAMTEKEIFVLGMDVGSEIVDTLFQDPLLPDHFLPKNWKGPELRKLFKEWNRVVQERSKGFWGKVKSGKRHF